MPPLRGSASLAGSLRSVLRVPPGPRRSSRAPRSASRAPSSGPGCFGAEHRRNLIRPLGPFASAVGTAREGPPPRPGTIEGGWRHPRRSIPLGGTIEGGWGVIPRVEFRWAERSERGWASSPAFDPREPLRHEARRVPGPRRPSASRLRAASGAVGAAPSPRPRATCPILSPRLPESLSGAALPWLGSTTTRSRGASTPGLRPAVEERGLRLRRARSSVRRPSARDDRRHPPRELGPQRPRKPVAQRGPSARGAARMLVPDAGRDCAAGAVAALSGVVARLRAGFPGGGAAGGGGPPSPAERSHPVDGDSPPRAKGRPPGALACSALRRVVHGLGLGR